MTIEEANELLNQIREALKASELRPAEIARRSGVSEATLSRFIAGKVSLSIELVAKVAPVVGLKLELRKKKR